MRQYYTQQTNFYGSTDPRDLVEQFGSPLYVYNEAILRQRCREMAGFIQYPNYRANYSTKANSSLELLKIIHEEGLHADAMSPGEIHVLLAAGFQPEEIFYIGNNVSEEEMQYTVDKGVTVSVDSLSQLETFGKIHPGGKVAVRINPGVGAGHHEKVVTGGKKTKFGINEDKTDEIKALLKKYRLSLSGINQHIGSQIMEGTPYLESVKAILEIAGRFEGLRFIDLGGGFGIPYHKQDGEEHLELEQFGSRIGELLSDWAAVHDPGILFKIEPGRYIAAECGILLGTVHALKENSGTCYAGTDLGFNTLIRPAMYDSWHDIEVYPVSSRNSGLVETAVTIVGNICESGDVIARDRMLQPLSVGDIIGVMDAGAYGYSMSSNYNNRLRPAEVLIRADGMAQLIRRRDTLDDLMRNFCCEPAMMLQR